MAKYNHGSSNLGCIGTAIVIAVILIFLAGNSMLITGDWDENNSANGLFGFVAIVGDIAVAGAILYLVDKAIAKKADRKAHARRTELIDAISSETRSKNTILKTINIYTNRNARMNYFLNLLTLLSNSSDSHELIQKYNSIEEERFAHERNVLIQDVPEKDRNNFPYLQAELSEYCKLLNNSIIELSEIKKNLGLDIFSREEVSSLHRKYVCKEKVKK